MISSITAYAFSTCALSGDRIRPGDEIVPMGNGRWALAARVQERDQKREAAQEFRLQLMTFINRLPSLPDRPDQSDQFAVAAV